MIILMGAVGSGKSEQATRLENRLGYPRVSTSQILRQHLTPELETKMHAGDLINDTQMIELLEPVLDKLEAKKQEYLLDGFPRSIPQVEWLTNQISQGELRLTAVFRLNVSHQVVLNRLLARGRADDTQEIILHRLEAYEQITNPVVKYLESQGIKVHNIDGEQPPNEVEKKIKQVLESQ